MALSPFCVGFVAQEAHKGINYRVKEQCDQKDEANDPGIQTQNLIVKKEQQNRKAIVLYAISNRTKSIAKLYPQRQLLRDGNGHPAEPYASLANLIIVSSDPHRVATNPPGQRLEKCRYGKLGS
jgi:hypothetical protein